MGACPVCVPPNAIVAHGVPQASGLPGNGFMLCCLGCACSACTAVLFAGRVYVLLAPLMSRITISIQYLHQGSTIADRISSTQIPAFQRHTITPSLEIAPDHTSHHASYIHHTRVPSSVRRCRTWHLDPCCTLAKIWLSTGCVLVQRIRRGVWAAHSAYRHRDDLGDSYTCADNGRD